MLGNVLADLLAAAIIGLVGLAAPVIWYYFSTYRSLLEFFGIQPKQRGLILYLSSLNVIGGGAVDASGIQRSFSGLALSADEATSVGLFIRLFSDLQAKPLYPLLRWMARKHWSMQIAPSIKPAPLQPTDIEYANIIALGTPGYNEVAGYYQQHGGPTLKWVNNNSQIQICKGPQTGQSIPNQHSQDLAILEKLSDDSHQTMIFLVAGIGVNGTRGAIHYLLAHWRELHKTYGRRPFAWCLSFPPRTVDPAGWERPTPCWKYPV